MRADSQPHAWWWLDILLIGLLAFILYTFYLGAYPLINPDEGRYSDVVREMLRHHNFITPFYNGIPFLDKPPLFYWLQTAFVQLLGLNEWGLRVWPATLATIGCIATYCVGRHLFNRQTGLTAAIILGTSLLYFVMAHVADLDLTVAMLITFSLLSALLGLEGSTSKQRGYFYSAFGFAALAVLTKGLIGLVIPMMIIGLWILILNRWALLRRLPILTGFLMLFIIAAPWFYHVQSRHPDFFHYFFYVQQFHRYTAHEFNSRHGVWFYPVIIVLGTLPWSYFVVMALIQKIRDTWHRRQAHPKTVFLLLWIISVTVFFSIPTSRTIGYILPLFPALALLTAIYLHAQTPLSKQRRFTLITLLALSFCIYPAIMWALTHFNQQLGLKTSKPLALTLKPRLHRNDHLIFYDNYYQDLAFYLDHTVLLAGDFKHETLKDIWRQDFVEGLKDPQYKNHALTLIQLKKLWKSPKTVYLFTTQTKVHSLKEVLQTPIYLVGHYQKLWVFSNQPQAASIV